MLKTTIRFLLCCSLAVGCAVASPLRADYLLVADTRNGIVSEVSPNGSVSTFTSGFWGVESLAIYNNNIFVSSAGPGNYTGAITEISPAGMWTTYSSGLNTPIGLAFDSSSNLFVAVQNDNAIYKVTPNGNTSIYSSKIADGLRYLAFDASGNLYATTANGIDRIASDGSFTTFVGISSQFTGLAMDAKGNFFAADADNGTVYEISPNGSSIKPFASGFNSPEGLVFDSSGNLFVANYGNGTISKVTPAGVVSTFATGFYEPRGLAVIETTAPAPSSGVLLGIGLCVFAGSSWLWRRRIGSAVRWQGS